MDKSVTLKQLDIRRILEELQTSETVWLTIPSVTRAVIDVPAALSAYLKVTVVVESSTFAYNITEYSKASKTKGSSKLTYMSHQRLFKAILTQKGKFDRNTLYVFNRIERPSLYVDLLYSMWKHLSAEERPRLLFLGTRLPEIITANTKIMVESGSSYIFKQFESKMPPGPRRKFENINSAVINRVVELRKKLRGTILIFAPDDKSVSVLTERLKALIAPETSRDRFIKAENERIKRETTKMVQGKRRIYKKLPSGAEAAKTLAPLQQAQVVGLRLPLRESDIESLQARDLVVVATDRTAVVVPTANLSAIVDTGLESFKKYTDWGKVYYNVDIAHQETSNARLSLLDEKGTGLSYSMVPLANRRTFFGTYHKHSIGRIYKPLMEVIDAGIDPITLRTTLGMNYDTALRALVSFGYVSDTKPNNPSVRPDSRYTVVKRPHYGNVALSYLHGHMARKKMGDGGRLVMNLAIATIANFRYGMLFYPAAALSSPEATRAYHKEHFSLFAHPQPLETSVHALLMADPAKYIGIRSLPERLRAVPSAPVKAPDMSDSQFRTALVHHNAFLRERSQVDEEKRHAAHKYAKAIAKDLSLRVNELTDTLEDVYSLHQAQKHKTFEVSAEDIRIFFLRFPKIYASMFPEMKFDVKTGENGMPVTTAKGLLYSQKGRHYEINCALNMEMSFWTDASAAVGAFRDRTYDSVLALSHKFLTDRHSVQKGLHGHITLWIAQPGTHEVVYDEFPKEEKEKVVTTGSIIVLEYRPPTRRALPDYEPQPSYILGKTLHDLPAIDFAIFTSMIQAPLDMEKLESLSDFAGHRTRQSKSELVTRLVEEMEYPNELIVGSEDDFWSFRFLTSTTAAKYSVPGYTEPSRFYKGGEFDYYSLSQTFSTESINSLHLKQIQASMKLYPRVRAANSPDPDGRTGLEMWNDRDTKRALLEKHVTQDGTVMRRQLTEQLSSPRALRMFQLSWFRAIIDLIEYSPTTMQSVLDLYSGWGAVASGCWLLDWTYQGVYTLSEQDTHMKAFFRSMEAPRHQLIYPDEEEQRPLLQDEYSLVVADVPSYQNSMWLEEEIDLENLETPEGFNELLQSTKETITVGISSLRKKGWFVLRCDNVIMRNALGKYLDKFPNMSYRGCMQVHQEFVTLSESATTEESYVVPEGDYVFLWKKESEGKFAMRFGWDGSFPGV